MASPKKDKETSSKLEALEIQVANSSEKNRNFFTATLVVFIYLSIVVVQTSDLDLLIGRGVHLPLIDVTMPIFAFYLIAPLMVLALHFNLLQNIENHHAKLIAWRDAHQNQPIPRESIYPFIFDFATLDETSTFSALTQFINQVAIYWSGPVTALLILCRFTDYQSWSISLYHFLVLCISLWLVMQTRKSVEGASTAKISEVRFAQLSSITFKEFLINFSRKLKNKFFLFFTWGVQGSSKHKLSNLLGISIWTFGLTQIILLTCLMISPTVHRIKTLGAESFFPRIVIDRRDNLLDSIANRLKLQFELRSLNQIKVDQEKKLKAEITITENLEIPPKTVSNITTSDNEYQPCPHEKLTHIKKDPANNFYDWFMQYGNGIDLRDRSMRLANLSYADLRRASFEGANLQGANLEFSQLQGAIMMRLDPSKAANLMDVNLQCANLQDAEMTLVNLQNANLNMANLQSVQIGMADMQHANFFEADFGQARMMGAQLQGANLINAHLESAFLAGANLQDANFEGAILEAANLQDANFKGTVLQGANLTKANLQNTSLYGAVLQNTKLIDAKLINVKGLAGCSSCEINTEPNIEVWINKKDEWASSYEIEHGLASKSKSKTDDLLAQMRREGWPR